MSCESIIGGGEYKNEEYCKKALIEIRGKMSNSTTTKQEYELDVIRRLGFILFNGPEKLLPIVNSTLWEAKIREAFFEVNIWPFQKNTEVKFFKWFRGVHWYAKIGNQDVIDSKGNQKWNTKKEAQKAAEWFKINLEEISNEME